MKTLIDKLKNWKTTTAGVGLSVLILAENLLSNEALTWKHVVIAGLVLAALLFSSDGNKGKE
jgi:hypothetical protein